MATYQSIKHDLDYGGKAGALIPIASQTLSGDSTIDFTSGLDSTYDEYLFIFTNIHPSDDNANLFMLARDGGSGYDAPITSTFFIAHNNEGDTSRGLQYQSGTDAAQVTSGINIAEGVGNANDENEFGWLRLYNPASTTFTKPFMSRFSRMYPGDDSQVDDFVAGYINVTAAIDAIQFKMNSNNIDSGTIQLFGVH